MPCSSVSFQTTLSDFAKYSLLQALFIAEVRTSTMKLSYRYIGVQVLFSKERHVVFLSVCGSVYLLPKMVQFNSGKDQNVPIPGACIPAGTIPAGASRGTLPLRISVVAMVIVSCNC